MRRILLCLSLLLITLSPVAHADTVSIPNTFVNGTPADAEQMNANFDEVEAAVNDNDARITAAQDTASAAAGAAGAAGAASMACMASMAWARWVEVTGDRACQAVLYSGSCVCGGACRKI